MKEFDSGQEYSLFSETLEPDRHESLCLSSGARWLHKCIWSVLSAPFVSNKTFGPIRPLFPTSGPLDPGLYHPHPYDEYAYCIPHPIRKPKYTKVKVPNTQDKHHIS